MATTAKRLTFAVALDAAGALAAEDGSQLKLPPAWTAEHLLLASLVRCSLTSLRYHARRAGHVVAATAQADGEVTRREQDGRYAFVAIRLAIDVELTPECEDVEALLERAERGCFIAASLTVAPRYRWRVDGVEFLR